MSEEERPREDEPNPTQQRLDDEGTGGDPADVSWNESAWGETERTPHQGEGGQRNDAA